MADYEVIASGSVDASAPATINITGISGTYKHLLLSMTAASTLSSTSHTDFLMLRFNADTGSNYGYAQQNKYDTDGTGTQSRSGVGNQVTCGYFGIPTRHSGQSTKAFAHVNFYLPLYSSTTFTKGVLVDLVNPYQYNWPTSGSNTGIGFHTGVAGWGNTAAITSFQLSIYEAVVSGLSVGFAVNSSYVLSGLA